ncbi:MAG TPA: MSHA biogenesis protein MshK [Burkholderiales bacterium]|nr:MSHA biogenesis protein MshK [Burkholderiales bacterium]
MKAIFAALVLGCVAGEAAAQGLSDPMRPPNATPAESNGSAAAGPVLQSILFARNRWYAVIDGQQVRLGEKFRNATLVDLTVSEATLRSAGATTVLKLYPEARKGPDRPGIQPIPTGTEEGDRK